MSFREMEPNITEDVLSEKILSKVKEELSSGICQEIVAVWTELWDEEERVKRIEIVASECQTEIRGLLEEILQTEKKARDNYIDRVEEILREIEKLQETLETPIPYEDVAQLPLHIMAARLNKKADKYRVIKNQRINKLNELSQKEAALCEKLGTIRQAMSISEVPKEAELKHLEDHITAMEQEKVNRTVTFLEQRQLIIKLFEELGIQPMLNFEKEVISESSIENFALTNENMKKLDDLRTKLEEQLQDSKEEVNELTQKLNLLWKYLDESESGKEEFLSKNQGSTSAMIKALKEEISRCESKKRENIALIVNRVRDVLVEEWDRCLIGKEEREKFRPFNLNCFTEDLCDLHEFEIKQLKNFYQDNEQIFVLYEKHKKLFNKLLDLENGSKNANRYYNRGGQLLKEEKERKVITKELPVVEEELRALLKKYEEEHGKPFTCFGTPMELILDEQWNAHFDQKTIEKLSRKKSDDKGRTPLGKRRCNTPYNTTSANKVPKLNNEKIASGATTPRLVRTAPRNVGGIRKKQQALSGNEAFGIEPTYDEFQSILQSKVEKAAKGNKPVTRSTAINDVASGILRERNTPVKVQPVMPLKTTPGRICSPMWSPSGVTTPKTVPRTRRQSRTPHLTTAGNRLPIII